MTLIAFCDCGAQYGYPHFQGCKEMPEPVEYEPTWMEIDGALDAYFGSYSTAPRHYAHMRDALKAAHSIRTKREP
jgi:hypothetical protein